MLVDALSIPSFVNADIVIKGLDVVQVSDDQNNCAGSIFNKVYRVAKAAFFLLISIAVALVSVRAIASRNLKLVIAGSVALTFNTPLMTSSINNIVSIIWYVFCSCIK